MKTLKLRIKDKHAKVLTELATQVNFVWNYVNAAKNILRIGRDTLVGGVLSKGDVNRIPADKGGRGNTTEMVANMARDFEGLATKCATHYEELKNEAKLLEDIQ